MSKAQSTSQSTLGDWRFLYVILTGIPPFALFVKGGDLYALWVCNDAIAPNTSAAVGMRLAALAEKIVRPSTITSSAPGAPMRIFEVTPYLRSISSFRLPACFLMSAHMKQRLISTFIVFTPLKSIVFSSSAMLKFVVVHRPPLEPERRGPPKAT